MGPPALDASTNTLSRRWSDKFDFWPMLHGPL